jgi:hypothetical protein
MSQASNLPKPTNLSLRGGRGARLKKPQVRNRPLFQDRADTGSWRWSASGDGAALLIVGSVGTSCLPCASRFLTGLSHLQLLRRPIRQSRPIDARMRTTWRDSYR